MMRHTTTTPSGRRRAFRAGLASDTLQRLPGAPFDGAVADFRDAR